MSKTKQANLRIETHEILEELISISNNKESKASIIHKLSKGAINRFKAIGDYRHSQGEIKNLLSGDLVKVKSNTEILINVVDSIIAARCMDGLITDSDVPSILFNGLKNSGFRFNVEDNSSSDEPWSLESLLDVSVSKEVKVRFIYVALFSDGMVKIGMSMSPEKRINVISKQSGRLVVDSFYTKVADGVNASKVEARILNSLSEFNVNGEWFDIDYQMAKAKVCAYAETVTFARVESKG